MHAVVYRVNHAFTTLYLDQTVETREGSVESKPPPREPVIIKYALSLNENKTFKQLSLTHSPLYIWHGISHSHIQTNQLIIK